MRKYLISIILLLSISAVYAQTTINTYTIWGTQGTTQDFVLTNGNNLTVNDTLVIYGNLELKNDADITINSGGVLIIVGDFDAKNKVDLAVGGTIVVTGDFNKNGSTGEIIDDGGDIYIFDDTPDWGGDLPDVDFGDEDDIINDPIIDIIGDIISSGCPLNITLDNIDNVSTPGGNDGAISITLTGNTAYNYTWATSNGSGLVIGDEDQSGLTAGNYNVAVKGVGFGPNCYVFGAYEVIEDICVPPSINTTTPGSRCGTGTVILGATASSGTINWYNVVTGGVSIGSGTSFTTPSISATTTYYVDATDAGCTTASRTSVVATVNSVPNVTLTASAVLDTICTGDNTQIEIDFTSGVGPFDFVISDGTNSENLSGIAADPFTYNPTTAPVWIPGSYYSDYYYIITSITDNNGCTNTNLGNEKVTVFKIPDTGEPYHIPSN